MTHPEGNQRTLLITRQPDADSDSELSSASAAFRNGLPITTHQDATRHGFGMKSMLHTVEQYGGTMQVDDTDSVFTLRILLPKNPESSTN